MLARLGLGPILLGKVVEIGTFAGIEGKGHRDPCLLRGFVSELSQVGGGQGGEIRGVDVSAVCEHGGRFPSVQADGLTCPPGSIIALYTSIVN